MKRQRTRRAGRRLTARQRWFWFKDYARRVVVGFPGYGRAFAARQAVKALRGDL